MHARIESRGMRGGREGRYLIEAASALGNGLGSQAILTYYSCSAVRGGFDSFTIITINLRYMIWQCDPRDWSTLQEDYCHDIILGNPSCDQSLLLPA